MPCAYDGPIASLPQRGTAIPCLCWNSSLTFSTSHLLWKHPPLSRMSCARSALATVSWLGQPTLVLPGVTTSWIPLIVFFNNSANQMSILSLGMISNPSVKSFGPHDLRIDVELMKGAHTTITGSYT